MSQPGQPRQRPSGQGSQARGGNRNRPQGQRSGGNNRGPGGGGGSGQQSGGGGNNRGGHRSKNRHGRNRDRNCDSNANPNQNQHPNQRPAQRHREQQEEAIPEPIKTIPKRYGLVMYETFAAAHNDADTIAAKAKEFDQLNICIRAEGDMDDAELCKFGKVFAGEAWTLIHERRLADGWYNEPH